MRFRILLRAALVLGSTTACADQVTEPNRLTPSAAVLDGAHAGTAHFFFLPPMVPAPAYTGTFDGSQSPVVTICVLSGNTCGATVASFSGSQIQVQVADQAYKVTWKTKGAGLSSDNVYRILVTVGGSVLGYADALVLNSGSTVKIVDQGQTVATVTGGLLPIRFRIEIPPPSTGVWKNNDYITYTQTEWGDSQTNGGALLVSRFDMVYGTFPLTVGSTFSNSHALIFTTSSAALNFLPQSGPPGPILGRFTDPVASNAGALGGEAVALMLNYQFSNAGHTPAKGGVPFGDLVLCGFPAPSVWNGVIVRDFLLTINTALVNGGVPDLTMAEVLQTATLLNESFSNGVASQFAQDHLVSGSCPGAWNQGDMTSYTQFGWGLHTVPISTLRNGFFVLYTSSNWLEVGLGGNAGYSMIFTEPDYVIGYLHDSGPPASLSSDKFNPGISESGFLGGATTALQLDVDFVDAGLLRASPGLRFGDLHVCGVINRAAIEGETIRALLARASQMLGGAIPDYGGPYDAGELWPLLDKVSGAFADGTASYWARAHIFKAACP